jgi:hypothetical protein
MRQFENDLYTVEDIEHKSIQFGKRYNIRIVSVPPGIVWAEIQLADMDKYVVTIH